MVKGGKEKVMGVISNLRLVLYLNDLLYCQWIGVQWSILQPKRANIWTIFPPQVSTLKERAPPAVIRFFYFPLFHFVLSLCAHSPVNIGVAGRMAIGLWPRRPLSGPSRRASRRRPRSPWLGPRATPPPRPPSRAAAAPGGGHLCCKVGVKVVGNVNPNYPWPS